MLKWFLTPEGKKVLVEDALKKGVLSERYPLPYLHKCADERPWKGVASTTQLLNGTRLEYLRILTPYAENPDGNAFRIIGTDAHKKLEDMTPVGSTAEISMTHDEITGIADLVESQPNGDLWLTDYKTWGSYKVGLALGLEKKKVPLLDADGLPVLYKTNGKGYLKGDPRMKDEYVINPLNQDIPDVELQLNRYRMGIEKLYGVKIKKLKVFIVARDGGTHVAKGRGITENTYMVDVKILDDNHVTDYFKHKKAWLLNSINSYFTDLEACGWSKDITMDDFTEDRQDFDLLKRYCPFACSPAESWDGRRCEKYCSVYEACKLIGNPYASI
jgi:hypothetical protein